VLAVAALHPQFWWWLARATGIVAWAMATAAVAWGLTLSTRLVRRRRLPAWILDLHRYLGTLTIAFVAVHLVALVADGWTHFGARELFVPMASTWRPRAVLWGIVALYGLAVIQLTSWGMRYFPRRVWHGIHLTSFVVFVTATVHAVLAGADRMNRAVDTLYALGVLLVTWLTVVRILDVSRSRVRLGDRVPTRVHDRPNTVDTPATVEFEPPTFADRVVVDPKPLGTMDPVLQERLARLGSRVKSRSGS
jgi:hypothetical protein